MGVINSDPYETNETHQLMRIANELERVNNTADMIFTVVEATSQKLVEAANALNPTVHEIAVMITQKFMG